MVSAWASENSLVLGQVRTDAKSNEITALPELLKLLDVSGCIVSIDAMGCQKEIARTILERGADYLLAVKGNQGRLYDDLRDLFEGAEELGYDGVPHEYATTLNKGHGEQGPRAHREKGMPDHQRPGRPGVPEHCWGLARPAERRGGAVGTAGGRAGVGGVPVLHFQPGIGGPAVLGGDAKSLGH